MSLSRLYLALAGLVEGILRQEYLYNKSGKYFLKAEYDLFPFKQIVLILGYFFNKPLISFGVSFWISESKLPSRLQVFIVSQPIQRHH